MHFDRKVYSLFKNIFKMKGKGPRMRMIQRPRTVTTIRQRAIVASCLLLLLVSGTLIIYFNLGSSYVAYAAAAGDFRSNASGNWNSTATWQRYNGTAWVAATAPPSSTDGVITVQNGHTVTVTAGVTVDQLVISTGGQVTINAGQTLQVVNGTGNDLDISGILCCTGTLGTSSNPTMIVQSGGKYQHNVNGGSIPNLTWNTNSTCEVTGTTTSVPGNINQTFENFTWNCPSQSGIILLSGNVSTIDGNFTVTSTGSSVLQMDQDNYTLDIGGDYIQTGGTMLLCFQSSRTGTMNVAGNYNQSGGNFYTVTGAGSTGTINMTGNWSHTGGTLSLNGGTGTTTINFKRSGTQTFTASGNTVSGNIDFKVSTGTTLNVATSVMTGRSFTLPAGATLMMGHAAGIYATGSSGNIQTTSRSFNAGAYYTYSGTVAQVTGPGLPATISNLTISNTAGVTLTATTSVSGILTLSSGRLITGSNEIRVTNTASAAITSHSATDYVVGNLRRSVNSSGTYDFPIGTSSNYEFISVTLSGTSGFSTLLATFTNTNPLTGVLSLLGIVINGFTIDKMLNYGYWTLTPNLVMLSGSYSVTVKEKGFSNSMTSANKYCVLKRANSLLPWSSVGTHNINTQSVSAGVVTAVRSGLTSFSDFAIAFNDDMEFADPTLISGQYGEVDAIYRFDNAMQNVDVWVKIEAIENGASLIDVDNNSSGYGEAWQPFVEGPANTASSITWRLIFKVAGTAVDTTLSIVAITAVDVDGSANIREVIEGSAIYSYASYPGTNITITNTATGYRAVSDYQTFSSIDTSDKEGMFQINYRDVNNFVYRTGMINEQSVSETRQNALYFHSFFNWNMALPVELVYFNASLDGKRVMTAWKTASEKNNDYFTVERSADGKNFTPVGKVKGSGNSSKPVAYSFIDQEPLTGLSYYRLRQTDFNGKTEAFELVPIRNGTSQSQTVAQTDANEIKTIFPNPFHDQFTVKINAPSAGTTEVQVLNTGGTILRKVQIQAESGESEHAIRNLDNLTPGIYFIRLVNGDQVSRIMKVVKN